MRRHVLLKLPPNEALLALLLLVLLGLHVLAVCPSMCSCSRSHREVDCSWRGLRQLPDGLQHNVHSLNLSHNRLHNLDGLLTAYTHLRFLDLSHNRLSHLPTGLPRSLWNLHASSNRLLLLDKNDTAYQWNLQKLDLSNNKLERAIFIKNTLINLCTLNMSHNNFWTLPTNMPVQLKTIDLSHNMIVRVLPGSLDRLLRLSHFYMHANRLFSLSHGVLDKLTALRVITLGNNPWACHLSADISYLLTWTQHTPARVVGCPCHTQPVCGEHPTRNGGWHFAPYNQPPSAASPQDLISLLPDASVTGRWYLSLSSLLSSQPTPIKTWYTPSYPFTATPISISTMPLRGEETHTMITQLLGGDSPAAEEEHVFNTDSHLISNTKDASSLHTTQSPFSDTSIITQTTIKTDMSLATGRSITTESPSIQTKKTSTLRTRSVRQQNQSVPTGISNSSQNLTLGSLLGFLHKLGLLFILQQII